MTDISHGFSVPPSATKTTGARSLGYADRGLQQVLISGRIGQCRYSMSAPRPHLGAAAKLLIEPPATRLHPATEPGQELAASHVANTKRMRLGSGCMNH